MLFWGKIEFFLCGILLFVSCSTRLPVAGINAFHSCDYSRAISIFDKKAKQEGKDYVLFNLALLSASLWAADYERAEKASTNAQRVMWSDSGKGKGVASLASAEAIKIFKGEPFEKAMASIYSGIIYFNKGDFDNARAAFSKAGLAIKQKKESHQEDFALPFLLQAKVFLKLGELDNARIALEKVKKIYPDYRELDIEMLKSKNILFLIELGQAPLKARTGPGASLIEWKRRGYAEQSASISVDDRPIGAPLEVGDLTVQAKTKGWSGKDTIQATKGATREAATVTAVIAADEASRGNKTAGWVALGAGLFALANQSQADIRQWEFLPDRILFLAGNIPPGKHHFQATFYDSSKVPLPGYDQVWYEDIKSERENRIFLIRRGLCSQGNVVGANQ